MRWIGKLCQKKGEHGSVVDGLDGGDGVEANAFVGPDGSRLTDHSGLAVRLALTETTPLLTSDPATAATHAEPEPTLF